MSEPANHQRDEKLKLLLLERADDFPDYDIVEFYIHVHKSKKDVKIHPKLIETEKEKP